MLACSYPAAVRGLVLALTSLRYTLTSAFDTPAGAYIEVEMPGDFFSHAGTLQFDLVDQGENQIALAGASEIKGQLVDWGKGKRALNEVFEKTALFARRLGG